MRKSALVLTAALILAAAAGCDLFHILGLPFGDRIPWNPKRQLDETAVQRDVQFADIPVPMAFELRRRHMFSYRSRTFRLATFPYEGAWPYRLTKDFYGRQMPKHGWSRLDERIGDTQAVEHWAKGSERARILYDNSGETIRVTIRVYPVGHEPEPIELQ
jgi:hypothetical protein